MRIFYLERTEDETGISGTGRVVEGIIWTSGKVSMQWLVKPYGRNDYDSLQDMIDVHGHSGKTVIKFE